VNTMNIDSDDDEETEAAKRRAHGKAITDSWAQAVTHSASQWVTDSGADSDLTRSLKLRPRSTRAMARWKASGQPRTCAKGFVN
jgi:hypothetical protein